QFLSYTVERCTPLSSLCISQLEKGKENGDEVGEVEIWSSIGSPRRHRPSHGDS
ncbi:hypothetical protein Dimus_008643, partial [Dionaea muscipula]